MAAKVGQFISSFDQFGAIQLISLFNSEPKLKTLYGGVISLLVYSLGIGYFIYLMLMWGTSQIQPSFSSQQIFIQGPRDFQINSNFYVFSLQMDGYNKTQTDALDLLQQQGNLLSYYTDEDENNALGYDCGQKAQQSDFFDPICMDLNNENQTLLYSNSMERSEKTKINTNIYYCDPIQDQNCLSSDQSASIQHDLVQYGSWRLTLITQDLNLKTGEIINLPRDFDFYVRQDSLTIEIQLSIQKATYFIDTGILFPNIHEITLIHSIDKIITNSQVNQYFSTPLVATIGYSLDNQETVIMVTYPKFGQILAQTASIFCLLIIFGLIMKIFNVSQIRVRIEEALLNIYFPQIREFEFKYNWRGQVKSINFQSQPLGNEDFNGIKKFRTISGRLVRQKLNYINIIYELSRVQISMQLKQPRQNIEKLKDKGYGINSQQLDSPNKVREYEDKELLYFEDFQLLSQQSRNVTESYQMKDFDQEINSIKEDT